jgi:hypothetical protein
MSTKMSMSKLIFELNFYDLEPHLYKFLLSQDDYLVIVEFL